MKKTFDVPLIILTAASPMNDGGGSDIGGTDSLKPLPMSFEEWSVSRWCADYDQNGGVTVDDYARWWSQSGLSMDAWTEFNPSVMWKDDWSF